MTLILSNSFVSGKNPTLNCGYFGGGGSLGAGSNSISGIVFTTDTVYSPAISLTALVSGQGTFSSYTSGYFCGGYINNTGQSNFVNVLKFESETLSNLGNILSRADYRQSGTNSSTDGYMSAGNINTDEIYGLRYSDESATFLSAVLATARYNGTSTSSIAYGYYIGGMAISTYDSQFERLKFSDTTCSTSNAVLSSGRNRACTSQSKDVAFISGGYASNQDYPPNESFAFATEATTTMSFGITTYFGATVSSETSGYYSANAKIDFDTQSLLTASFSFSNKQSIGGVAPLINKGIAGLMLRRDNKFSSVTNDLGLSGNMITFYKGTPPTEAEMNSFTVSSRSSDKLLTFKSTKFSINSIGNTIKARFTDVVGEVNGLGTVSWFIIGRDSDSNTCQFFGSVGLSGSGADMILSKTSVVSNDLWLCSNLYFDISNTHIK